MGAVEDILAQIPMSQLAGQLGVDEQTAEQATRHALPALLGGIQANAEHPDGAASFEEAVQQHDGGLVTGGVDLGQVDTGDGQRIVGHVFGENSDQVAQRLGGAVGDGGHQDLMRQLLPLLAPIVMSYLAKRLSGGSGAASGAGGGGSGGALGDLLGGLLGGGGGGGLLGSVLGGVLGGGSGGSDRDRDRDDRGSGPDLGGLLGGLLGGGRR
jgi:hypothetical protein